VSCRRSRRQRPAEPNVTAQPWAHDAEPMRRDETRRDEAVRPVDRTRSRSTGRTSGMRSDADRAVSPRSILPYPLYHT
jgi:hypothetical protein